MRVLFITPHPQQGASTRYRVKQFFPYFKSQGVECIFRPFITPDCYKILYKNGYLIRKGINLFKGLLRRAFEFINLHSADIVFVHLEASPLGIPVFERLFSYFKKPLIYDLDDAIYMRNISSANKLVNFFRNPSKISEIIKISSHVIVCNDYLGQYAGKFNQNITMIPTSVDTDSFRIKDYKNSDSGKVVIGWIGSYSTARYLAQLKGVFEALSERYDFILKIIGSDKKDYFPGIRNVVYSDWSLETDVTDFQNLDIGIYPLPDDEWVKGKTGFKTVQYMAVGVPCVVSKVARNVEIVEDGINGFLASCEDEWIDKISRLIESPELRKQMGLSGRESVEERFSVRVNAPKYLDLFNRVYNKAYGKRNA